MPATNRQPIVRALWKPHPEREARMASAVALARWAVTAEHLLLAHQRRLLSQAIWWCTECDGKFTTRYRTAAVVGDEIVNVRHEHVVQRKGQIDGMLAHPEQVDEIMASSLACIVSTAEHDLLKPFDHLDGWTRYTAAGLTVIDMKDGTNLDLGTAPAGAADSVERTTLT